jgi:hypothetical protein
MLYIIYFLLVGFYIQEVSILLRIQTHSQTVSPENDPMNYFYQRTDICEVESEMVSCLLRILINYGKQIEKLVKKFNEKNDLLTSGNYIKVKLF